MLTNALLHELLDKSANGILLVDENSIIHYANEKITSLFGYSLDALIGASIETLIPVEYRAHHAQHVTRTFADKAARTMGKGESFLGLRQNGETISVRIDFSPTDDNQYRVVSVSETTRYAEREQQILNEKQAVSNAYRQVMAFTTQTTNALAMTDSSFNLVWANDAFTTHTGYHFSEVKHKTLYTLKGPETQEAEIARIENALIEQTHYEGELRFHARNGSSFWVRLSLQPYVEAQKFIGYMILMTDINEQKRLESRLTQSSQFQQAMLDSAPLLLMGMTTEGRITLFNQFASELLGYSADDVVGKLSPFAFLPDDAMLMLCEKLSLPASSESQEMMAAVLKAAQEKPFRVELRHITSTGEALFIAIVVTPITSDYSDDLGYLWLGQDITQQRIAERDNLRTQQILLATGEISQVGGWVLDLVTQEVVWSDEVYRIHELPIGTPVVLEDALNYYAPEARAVITAAVETAVANGTSWDEQLPFVTAKGNHIWVRAIGYAEYENDKPVRLFGAFQNISSLKAAEQEALAASAAKSEFLANMSHEMRTPLNGVLGLNQLLQKTPLTEQQQKYTQLINASGNKLLRIINDVLDIAKIEAGKLSIALDSCPIRSLIDKTIESLSAQVEQLNRPILIEANVDDDVGDLLLTDAGRLQQILDNLCGNAIKFTLDGTITLRVTRQDECLLFAISDTGAGIEAHQQAKLFEKFTQVDASHSRAQEGTGLGLAICKQLVTLLGGEIGVKSTLHQGSTFWFTHPLHDQIASEVTNHGTAQVDRQVDGSESPNLILATINNTFIQQWKDACTRVGMPLVSVSSARQAMAQMRVQAPLAIIIYDRLNGMTGPDFAQHLRHHPQCRGVKIIRMTDSTPENDVRDQTDYLFSTQDITAALNTAVSRADTSLSVLLVEDNSINQIVANDMLTQCGCRVEVAVNGAEAVAIATERLEEFDLILMDCQMPVMDGYEATRCIRALPSPRAQTIPIIALTANALEEDKQRGVAAGMNAHLIKPILLSDLERALFTFNAEHQ
ncbi:PAS domain-containing hybrid sensor histidine kinase/response regulator [Alteromonas oceanisediminis]|uniref:PAS domain-containing hybrid sensor histidine kinase/response regulator n=1 Tax=Alteromonas oceanisediminis TaxID=2836180 RepID=UPI001BD9E932|nr:PAS domain S-box protein [Alteromonas oceanisediminis]MBT0585649.1 PAS domain S-box protein [Alteromonas oceanisediminis]